MKSTNSSDVGNYEQEILNTSELNTEDDVHHFNQTYSDGDQTEGSHTSSNKPFVDNCSVIKSSYTKPRKGLHSSHRTRGHGRRGRAMGRGRSCFNSRGASGRSRGRPPLKSRRSNSNLDYDSEDGEEEYVEEEYFIEIDDEAPSIESESKDKLCITVDVAYDDEIEDLASNRKSNPESVNIDLKKSIGNYKLDESVWIISCCFCLN